MAAELTPTDPPTEPGWYFARWKRSGEGMMCLLVHDCGTQGLLAEVGTRFGWSLDELDWFGPVPMPGATAVVSWSPPEPTEEALPVEFGRLWVGPMLMPVTADQRAVIAAHAARTGVSLDVAARQLDSDPGGLAARTAQRIADAVLAAALAPDVGGDRR